MLCAALMMACNNGGGVADDGATQDVEMTASSLEGEYCGKVYDTPDYNYYLIFSDKGFTADGDYQPNARYYYIDLYSATASQRGAEHRVPTGAYALDVENTCVDGTISALYSHLYETDASAKYDPSKEQDFTEAVLVVRADGSLTLEAATEDGRRHRIVFTGDYSLEAVPGSGADGPYTTLTEDRELDFSSAVGMADYYGDYFGVGYAHWIVMLAPSSGTGDALQLTLMSEGLTLEDGFAGTYTCSSGGESGTFYPGVFDYDLMDSWYCYMVNRQMPDSGPWAPLVDGRVTITKMDDRHLITLDCRDDALTPNRITASWQGVVTIENRARASVQSLSCVPRLLTAPSTKASPCTSRRDSKPRR